MPTPQQIRERLAAGDRFPLAEVRRWMADESDLGLWAAVYDVLGPGWELIEHEPDTDETCAFMTRYLLRCIHQNVQYSDGYVPGGYVACARSWCGPALLRDVER